jgi:hypothetical protein
VKKIILFLVVLICFIACGNKTVSVDLLTENGKEIYFELAKQEVVNMYAEIEIEYKVKPLFIFHCSFYKDSVFLVEGGTDPLVTLKNEQESLTIKDGITHWKFYGKLDGNLSANNAGVYSIKTTFLKNKQEDLKIIRANIVFIK